MRRKPSHTFRENDIVGYLRQHFAARTPSLVKGIGDDAAVIQPAGADEYWVFTTDLIIEDVHFRRSWMSPRQLGHKALAVNLSDVAAMGARPRFYTVALGLPKGITHTWIENFYDGMTVLGRMSQAILVGGDLSRSPSGIKISVAVLGETVQRRIVYRGGGKPEDILYVTGCLGMSAAGFMLLESGRKRGQTRAETQAIRAHREPEPRCKAGLWLARHRYVRAMMDLSDGISSDLPRMCVESGTGAEIYLSQLPLFWTAQKWHADPVELGLHGGEDYELLFAVPPFQARALERMYPSNYPRITRIGRLTPHRGVVWMDKPGTRAYPLRERGFDHFRR